MAGAGLKVAIIERNASEDPIDIAACHGGTILLALAKQRLA